MKEDDYIICKWSVAVELVISRWDSSASSQSAVDMWDFERLVLLAHGIEQICFSLLL